MPDGTLADIERRVAADRAALAQSIDLLGDTLSPDRLRLEAAHRAREYGSQMTRQVTDAARQNPAGLVLIGAGLALLISGAGRREPADHAPGARSAGPIGSDRLRAALKRGLDELSPEARQRVLNARLSAIAAQEAVERNARGLSRSTARTVRTHPVATGIAAFGLGALIAAALPSGARNAADPAETRRDALMRAALDAYRRERAPARPDGPMVSRREA